LCAKASSDNITALHCGRARLTTGGIGPPLLLGFIFMAELVVAVILRHQPGVWCAQQSFPRIAIFAEMLVVFFERSIYSNP
jgi:hypothetical protein